VTANSDAKRELRQRLKALRQAHAGTNVPKIQHSLEVRLRELIDRLGPRAVFVYLATAGEVETRGLIDALLARGVDLLVPAILDATHMAAVSFPGWDRLQVGRLGIPSPPAADAPPGTADVVIVPGLGFSPRGERIGFGAGYYDRWLADHPHATRIGICFEFQVCARIPVEAHDERLHYLVTERRTIHCRELV
jgi:5-formyltetrahydrofolate cyclo-ligase